MVSLIQSNYRGMGSRHVPARAWASACRTAASCSTSSPGQRQHLRAGQAPLPHHHPGLRHQGRQALAQLRRDGRRHAAAGPRPDRRQPDRLRHEPAGGRRRAAHPAHRQQRADRRGDDRRRHGVTWRAGIGYARAPRAGRNGPPDRRSTWARSAATRPSCSTPRQGVYYGASESRKDGQAAGY